MTPITQTCDNNSQLHQSPTLTVEKVRLSEVENKRILKTARAWNKLAAEKEHVASVKEMEDFMDARKVTQYIANSIKKNMNPQNHTTTDSYDSIYTAKDSSDTIQAICLTRARQLSKSTGDLLGRYQEIQFLATNPINIRAACNSEETRAVRGAATAVITHLVSDGAKNGFKGLYAESLVRAKGFYKKMKFTEHYSRDFPLVYNDTIPMTLKCPKLPQTCFKESLNE